MRSFAIELRRDDWFGGGEGPNVAFTSADKEMYVDFPLEVDDFLGNPDFITITVADGRRLKGDLEKRLDRKPDSGIGLHIKGAQDEREQAGYG